MKKILVPCDFSKPAIQAFRFALDVALQSKGVVHLLHVIELPVMNDTLLMPVLNFEAELLKEMSEKAEKVFPKIISKYNTENVKVMTTVEFGNPTPVILNYVEREGMDVIIMGSHGASGLQETFVGSHAEKIVRRAKVPVLVLKDLYKGPVKSIVFPNTLDLENQEDLVMKVKALQDFFKAKLHIVWINTPVNFTSDNVTFERLTTFAKRFKFKDVSLHVFSHPDQEEGIFQFTKMIKGDMIAMATHGRRGLAHLMNSNLAEGVVNHSEKLIWTYTLKNEPVEA